MCLAGQSQVLLWSTFEALCIYSFHSILRSTSSLFWISGQRGFGFNHRLSFWKYMARLLRIRSLCWEFLYLMGRSLLPLIHSNCHLVSYFQSLERSETGLTSFASTFGLEISIAEAWATGLSRWLALGWSFDAWHSNRSTYAHMMGMGPANIQNF